MLKIIFYRLLMNILGMLKDLMETVPLGIVCGLIAAFIINKRARAIEKQRRFSIILLTMYISIMLQMAVLFRDWGSILEIDLIPFDRHGGFRYIVLYGIANAFVFLPVGILIPKIWEKMNNVKKIVLVGFVGSLFIELTQLLLQCGVCQAEDLIMNTVGTGIGFCIYKIINNK